MIPPFSPDECHPKGWIDAKERLSRRLQFAAFYDRSPEHSDLVEAFSFVRTYRQRYGYEAPDCRLESICLSIEAALTAPFRVTDREAVKQIAPGNMRDAA